MRKNLYFAANEGHKCNKQSLKITTSFDDKNRRCCVLNICFFFKRLSCLIFRNKHIIHQCNYIIVFVVLSIQYETDKYNLFFLLTFSKYPFLIDLRCFLLFLLFLPFIPFSHSKLV